MSANSGALTLEQTLIGPPALDPPPTRHALFVLLIALAAILHIGAAGHGDLQNETEGQYAAAAKEMIANHGWLLPTNDGLPRLQKPPVLYWLIILSDKIFGVTVFAARFPIALGIIASVALTFLIGERLGGYWRGFIAGLIHLCLCGTFLLGRIIMPEPVFGAFISGAVLCVVAIYQTRGLKRRWLAGFWVCCALACLTKGIHGLLYPATICVILSLLFRDARLRLRRLLDWRWLALFFVITVPWYIWTECHTPGFFRALLLADWSEHLLGADGDDVPVLQFLAMHLAWWFPASLLILPGLLFASGKIFRFHEMDFKDALPLCWMAVIFVPLFFLGDRQDYYSMTMWGGFAIWAATAWERVPRGWRIVGVSTITAVGVALCFLALRIPSLVGGRPEEWADSSMRTTAWTALNAIPAAMWLSFRPMIAVTALALTLSGGAAIFFLLRNREDMAIAAVLAAMIPAGLSGVEGVAKVSPFFSLADAARFIEPKLGETGRVFFEGSLHSGSSLLFFLEHKLMLVNQQPDGFERLGDPTTCYLSENQLLANWSGADPIFLVVEESRVAYWQTLVASRVHIYHKVSTCGTYAILSNQL